MSSEVQIVDTVSSRPSSREDALAVGDWYWVKDTEEEWLGCIVKIGSNYAELHGVGEHHCVSRVHFNEFDSVCRYEPNWKQVIESNVQSQRNLIAAKLEEARLLAQSLGVGPQLRLEGGANQSGRELAVVSNQRSRVKRYKRDLVRAKERTLPQIQEEVKGASECLASWLTAETLPMRAVSHEIEDSLERINDRIFAVELYAGLTEEVVQVRKGKPAIIDEKLHIMQRRLYMDEECVAGYRAGGIDCRKIETFDKWLARKENFARLLPFERTIAAFRVRREAKQREWDGSLMRAYVNFQLDEEDKSTFLYIRNGEQLYRLTTALDFGTKLFPDREEFDIHQKLWVRAFAGRVEIDSLISDQVYQARLAEQQKNEGFRMAWMKGHKGEMEDYEPFDETSVYYDDVAKAIGPRISSYNRIALIVQGLFDRSTVLHPHPPVKLWTPESSKRFIEMVYDGAALYKGEAPDFEAYRALCNQSLGIGSVTVGQEDFWERKEAEKEGARRDRDWRDHSNYRPTRYRPYSDPGPGLLAFVNKWQPRARKATYFWKRDRRTYSRWDRNDPVDASLTVSSKELLNVTAYQPGDFRRFYSDYRTRVVYLRWAPLLLAAEEYHAGNLKPGESK